MCLNQKDGACVLASGIRALTVRFGILAAVGGPSSAPLLVCAGSGRQEATAEISVSAIGLFIPAGETLDDIVSCGWSENCRI